MPGPELDEDISEEDFSEEEDEVTTTIDELEEDEEDTGKVTNGVSPDAKKSTNLTSKSDLLRSKTDNEEAAEIHDSLIDNIGDLLDSKKRGFFRKDSNQMQRLKDSLIDLIDIFYARMPESDKEFEQGLEVAMTNYRKAIKCADDYITYITENNKGKHSTGRTRLALARDIKKKMTAERRLFAPAARGLKENRKPGENIRWKDALTDIRGRKIDLNADNVTIVGAGASRIYKVGEADGKTSYIKTEEKFLEENYDAPAEAAMYRSTSPEAATFLNFMEECLEKRFHVNPDKVEKDGEKQYLTPFYVELNERFDAVIPADKDSAGKKKSKEQIREELVRENTPRLEELFSRNDAWKEIWPEVKAHPEFIFAAVDLSVFMRKKETEYSTGVVGAGIERGSTVSDRNVSSYRLAQSLGQGDIVAKSETIMMEDGFGRAVRANSMEEATGMNFVDAKEYAEKNNMLLSFTPGSLTQFFNMRVMDMISGQVDRHGGNFMVQTHEAGNMLFIDSIKAIDNDMAFGEVTYEKILTGAVGNLDPIVSKQAKGLMTVKFISEDMYQRIMDYDDRMIAYDHMDIRSQREIEALQKRMDAVRQHLKILVRSGQLKLVKTKEEMEAAYEEAREYYSDAFFGNMRTQDMLKAIR